MMDARLSFIFRPMDAADARLIMGWQYAPPYTMYNPDPAALEEDVTWFTDPQYHYYSVRDATGDLIAFRCYGEDAQVFGGDYSADALDTGGGLRPDLTGRGLGGPLLRAGLAFGRQQFHPHTWRVTVAAWNARALRMCEHAGFVRVQTFRRPSDDMEFIILTCPA
jgi:RimJ/RimL family protein N-acetyltransferase